MFRDAYLRHPNGNITGMRVPRLASRAGPWRTAICEPRLKEGFPKPRGLGMGFRGLKGLGYRVQGLGT